MNKLIGLALMLVATSSPAQPEALVQAVQMPAWLQRGENTAPVRAGTELQNGDKLITGSNARIYVQTADGSTVKLGEKAILTLQGLTLTRQQENVFSALLDVAKGAFRFTTASIAKLKGRDVTVRVAGATVGIRGTDVWGKVGGKMNISAMEKAMGKNLDYADKETKRDFDTVCLIEGKISVTHGSDAPFVMDQAQSFYVMLKDEAPLPVGGLSSEQLANWATETEIALPSVQLGGKWKVNLLTAPDQASALSAFDQWRSAGYDVRLLPTGHQGSSGYALRITQLPSRVEAEKLALQLKGTLGAENPSVSR